MAQNDGYNLQQRLKLILGDCYFFLLVVIGLCIASTSIASPGNSYTLIGYMPDFYFNGEWEGELERSSGYKLVSMKISKGVIDGEPQAIEGRTKAAIKKAITKIKKDSEHPVIELKRNSKADWDVIYPGLLDLHSHTKQNMLPLWQDAKGQFTSRWEWREWGEYSRRGSWNMNPWITHGAAISCAAFRWSEIQAMVLGTTYLQGPSSTYCVSDFAIHRVEDSEAFHADTEFVWLLLGVQAPTDVVRPSDSLFAWKELWPEVKKGKSYDSVFTKLTHKYCPSLKDEFDSVLTDEALGYFNNKKKLKAVCTKLPEGDPNKFIRYANWMHPSVVGKIRYRSDEKSGPIITHLGEGMRNDPFTENEFNILKAMGMDLPFLNFIHGVGLKRADFRFMAKPERQMGLIWSPFSNLILYGETADIMTAHEEGVYIALGSDWSPTGTKSTLEELKVARNYIHKDPKGEGLKEVFTDEYLYNMATHHAAVLLNQHEADPNDHYHGVGSLLPDATASIIAVRKNHKNVFTNLVLATAKDIDLVMVDGEPIYGEIPYLEQAKEGIKYEKLPAYFPGVNKYPEALAAGKIPSIEKVADKTKHMVKVAEFASKQKHKSRNACGFSKGFVYQDASIDRLTGFNDSGLDLNLAGDLQKLLAANLLTQSYNNTPITTVKKKDGKETRTTKGLRDYRIQTFPALYTCNDKKLRDFMANYITPKKSDKSDHFSVFAAERKKRRGEKSDRNAIGEGHDKRDKAGKISKTYGF